VAVQLVAVVLVVVRLVVAVQLVAVLQLVAVVVAVRLRAVALLDSSDPPDIEKATGSRSRRPDRESPNLKEQDLAKHISAASSRMKLRVTRRSWCG